MANSVQCPNCNKYTPSEYTECLSCGAIVSGGNSASNLASKSDLAELEEKWNAPNASKVTSPGSSIEAVMGWVILIVIMVFVFRGYFGSSGSPSSSASPDLIEALTACQYAIRDASLDHVSAEVPYVQGRVIRGEAAFAWPRGSGLRLKNGFGALLDASAACEVDLASNRIKFVSINGKRVF